MSATRAVLSNSEARRVFLHRHLLGDPPKGSGRGDDLLGLIRSLGFVQVDSVNTVERAHHMILFARRPAYRPKYLAPLLERDRHLFEHWTHDAAIVPTAFFPHWRLRFAKDAAQLHAKWTRWQGEGYRAQIDRVRDHVARHGAVRSGDLADKSAPRKGTGWWDWHPSKAALEFLWRTGELSVARRENFAKVYDLTERVVPETVQVQIHAPDESADWFNSAALDRLGFGTSGQISAFWDHVPPKDASVWCKAELAAGRLEEVDIEGADGKLRRIYAKPGLVESVAALPAVTGRLRILSPFDPALRDRQRAEFLFGFHYRIEIFVPEAKRKYGYYVFPILEGDRLIGRIDMKAQRSEGILAVRKLWLEPGVAMTKGRLGRLESELNRMARFAGLNAVETARDWLAE